MASIYVPFEVSNQTLRTRLPPVIVRSGTAGVYGIEISFASPWTEMQDALRVFFFRSDNVYKMDMIKHEDGAYVCDIPDEAVADAGICGVGVACGAKLLTNTEYFPVLPSFQNELYGDKVLDWFEQTDQLIAGLRLELGDLQTSFEQSVQQVQEAIRTVEAKIPTVPQKVSAFANDAGYQTAEQVKAMLPNVPTKVSAFTNDAGYQTEAQVTASAQAAASAVEAKIPTVPIKVSAFSNDAKYQTETQVQNAVQFAYNQFANHEHDDRYYSREYLDVMLETVEIFDVTVTVLHNDDGSETWTSSMTAEEIVITPGTPRVVCYYKNNENDNPQLQCIAYLRYVTTSLLIFSSPAGTMGETETFIFDRTTGFEHRYFTPRKFERYAIDINTADQNAATSVFAVQQYAQPKSLVITGEISFEDEGVYPDDGFTGEMIENAIASGSDVRMLLRCIDTSPYDMTGIQYIIPLVAARRNEFEFSGIVNAAAAGEKHVLLYQTISRGNGDLQPVCTSVRELTYT